MSFPPLTLKAIATELAERLIARKETVSIVETATGGLMSSALLSIPGTSACFKGGVNAYSLAAREVFLGWTQADTDGYAGPTEAIVLKLAAHVREALGSTWALAESGVAGPSRPDKYRAEIKGPGFCPIAVVGPVTQTKTIDVSSQGLDRGANMVAFAEAGLGTLLEILKEADAAKGAGVEEKL